MGVRGTRTPPGRESLSEATFEQVLARAAEMDDRASSRLDVPRAREIALDLGVSPGAWDAALADHERDRQVRGQRSPVAAVQAGRHLLIAAGSSQLFGEVFSVAGLSWFLAAVVGGAAIAYRVRATPGVPSSGADTA